MSVVMESDRAAAAVELWSELLRTWEGFRCNEVAGHSCSASGIQLFVGPPTPLLAVADRRFDVLVGVISPVINCSVTIETIKYGKLIRLRLKKGVPELILRNNCIPMFTLNCHIVVSLTPQTSHIQLVYAKLPNTQSKKDLGIPAVIIKHFVVDVILRKRKACDTNNAIVLPSYTPWQVMTNRKRQWLCPILSELMAAACRPERLPQILDVEELAATAL